MSYIFQGNISLKDLDISNLELKNEEHYIDKYDMFSNVPSESIFQFNKILFKLIHNDILFNI